MRTDKDSYDAVIIGAGIGGLVCGCYLAKAGMKVLIAEQHHKPGGYCTSFKRHGLTFDAAAHSFGGYREGGIVREVFRYLRADALLTIQQFDPSDIIQAGNTHITFSKNLELTREQLQEQFPHERYAIARFIDFISNPPLHYFVRMRNSTMKSLLDDFFHDNLLKAVLAYPLFGNGGLPPSRMSAMIGAKIFQEFLLDGGYYPEGGMQMIPDALSHCFSQAGGELRLSSRVEKISKQGDIVDGVIIENQGFIPARLVISNCDTRQTFIEMLGDGGISEEFANNIKKMVPSISMFILYAALKQSFTTLPDPGVNMWFLPTHNIENIYSLAMSGSSDCLVMVRKMPGAHAILAYAPAAFMQKQFWSERKTSFIERLIAKIEDYLIPELSMNIIYKGAATPQTLYEYTLNYQGAAYGWSCTPSQIAVPHFKTQKFIRNLYSVGHWTTQGLGIPGVVHVARDVARHVQKKWNNRHNSVVM